MIVNLSSLTLCLLIFLQAIMSGILAMDDWSIKVSTNIIKRDDEKF